MYLANAKDINYTFGCGKSMLFWQVETWFLLLGILVDQYIWINLSHMAHMQSTYTCQQKSHNQYITETGVLSLCKHQFRKCHTAGEMTHCEKINTLWQDKWKKKKEKKRMTTWLNDMSDEGRKLALKDKDMRCPISIGSMLLCEKKSRLTLREQSSSFCCNIVCSWPPQPFTTLSLLEDNPFKTCCCSSKLWTDHFPMYTPGMREV